MAFRTPIGTLIALAGIGASVLLLADAVAAQGGQRIRIHVGHQDVLGTLNNGPAARDFAAMLPLALHLSDLLQREKVAQLPGPLSKQSRGEADYTSGELGYWRPENNFVIYYKHDVSKIPSPGIVPLGKLDDGVTQFNVEGNVDVTIDIFK